MISAPLCPLLLLYSRIPLPVVLWKTKEGGAGRPATRPKKFVKFYGCKLSSFKHASVKFQTCLCKEKLNYPICNAMMDMCHVPQGQGSGLESGAGLSIPLVWLSSPDGVFGDDTFFHHTFLGVGGVSTFVFCDSRNFLRWNLRLAFF